MSEEQIKNILDQHFSDSPEDYSFVNVPEPKTEVDYHKAKREFVNYYKLSGGVHAIYQYGRFSKPGISDLDFIVILKDDYKHSPGLMYDIKHFSDNTRYILYHNQAFTHKSAMENIQWYLGTSALQKVYGKDVNINGVSEDTPRMIQVLSWMNNFITDHPKFVLSYLIDKTIDVRRSLAKLKYIGYYYNDLNDFYSYKDKDIESYMVEYSQLRENWFENENRYNDLIRLIKQSIILRNRVMKPYVECIKKTSSFGWAESKTHECTYFRRGEVTYFVDDWDPVHSLTTTIEHYQETGVYAQMLPKVFSLLLMEYARLGGPLGESIKVNLDPLPSDNSVDQESLMIKTGAFLNECVGFIYDRQVSGHSIERSFSDIKRFDRKRGDWRAHQLRLALLNLQNKFS